MGRRAHYHLLMVKVASEMHTFLKSGKLPLNIHVGLDEISYMAKRGHHSSI